MSEQSYLPLDIIILNWNLAHETIACLESLQKNDLSGVRLIVVDNYSSNDSVAQLTTRFGDKIHLIQNDENLGFAQGMNVGIKAALQAQTKAVLLLNNDTIAHPKMIYHLRQAAQNLPQAGILEPAIYYHQAPECIWRCGDREFGGIPLPVPVERIFGHQLDQPLRLDYVPGCCMFIKRAVFEKIGVFDPRYFMYFEDADFCWRARQAQYEIWCIPAAKLWHKVSLSAKKDKPANRYAQSWGRVQFYRRRAGGLWAVPVLAYLFLKLLLITSQDINHGNWKLIKPLWAGAWAGLKVRP